jgi:hypothetical protein
MDKTPFDAICSYLFEDGFFLDTLRRAEEENILEFVEQGYCFYCHQEKSVYGVVSRDVPAQPPRCPDCFTNDAMRVVMNPGMREALEAILAAIPEE